MGIEMLTLVRIPTERCFASSSYFFTLARQVLFHNVGFRNICNIELGSSRNACATFLQHFSRMYFAFLNILSHNEIFSLKETGDIEYGNW